MKRVVLAGYFGNQNLGDEAILASMLAGLEARGIAVTVLSSNPKKTEETYHVPAIKRTNLAAVSKALMSADLLVQGGGSLIQDKTSWRSPLFYLAQDLHALVVGTPFMIFAQGIGPIGSSAIHFLTRETLVHARALTLRDAGSYAWALRNLPHDLPMALTADPVYLMEPARPEKVEEIAYRTKLDQLPKPWTLLAVKGNPKDKRELFAWTEGLNTFQRDFGGTLVLCPFFPAEDGPFYTVLDPAITGPHVRLPDTLLPREVLGLIGHSDFVIAGRLHPLIMAANRQVPFGAITYDPKMTAAAAEFEQEPVAQRPLIGPQGLIAKLGDAAEDPEWPRRYARALPALKTRATANYEVLERVLYGELHGSRVTLPPELREES